VTALMGAVDVPQGATVAQIELRDSANALVGTAELLAGRDAMEWSWDQPGVQPYVQHQRVESAGLAFEGNAEPRERQLSFADLTFDRPITASTLTVRATPPTGELTLFGGSVLGPDGSVQQLFGRTKTKYRQVYVDNDIRVLEDTTALPRAFLVPSARVAPSLGSALNEMVHRPFQPDQEVILAADANTEAPGLTTNRGGTGTATITSYADASVEIHTSASSDAWLVLSDTYYPGWVATVDGQRTAILRGDVLFRVVPVPAGEHDVEFRFEPKSVQLGLWVSLASLLALVVAVVVAGGWVRPGRTTSE
jgi:hypothetical protein